MGTVLNRQETADALGISPATLDRMWRTSSGNSFVSYFPKPIMRHDKVSGWDADDIEAYKQASKAGGEHVAQSAPVPPPQPNQDDLEAKLAHVARELSRNIEIKVDEQAIAENIDYKKLAEAMHDEKETRDLKTISFDPPLIQLGSNMFTSPNTPPVVNRPVKRKK
jgi:predicted DNA-binding transcriptional regulator AlpA